MNIHSLKDSIFTDLKTPLSFLDHRGFVDGLVVDSARAYGNTVYFFADGQDWHTLSEEIKLTGSDVNTFTGDRHTCRIETSDTWSSNIQEKLCACAKLVYDRGLLPIATDQYSTFESFWNDCTKQTKRLLLSDFAYTKRGHKKQFINMYNSMEEITGQMTLAKDSIVQMPIRWTLVANQDVEMTTFGFRPSFCGGIRVIKMAGPLPVIRRNWDWSSVDFKSLTIPMHESFIVSTPAVEVIDTFGTTFKVAFSNKPEFAAAMHRFHAKAGSPPWDGTIHLRTSKPVSVGGFVLAKIVCDRNKGHINWHTEKFFLVNRPIQKSQSEGVDHEATVVKTGGMKRDADNMDNSPGVKTKRQCTPSDIHDHMKE
jgi:hypothetical protein